MRLKAAPTGIELIGTAEDAAQLETLKDVVARHRRFGVNDQLTVSWTPQATTLVALTAPARGQWPSAGTAAVLGTGQIRETVSWLVSVSTRYCHAGVGVVGAEAAVGVGHGGVGCVR